MQIIKMILIFGIVISIFIYTISYGKFVWSQNNKLGALAIMLLALTVLLLPILTILARG